MSTATTLEVPVVYADAAATMALFPARIGAVRELIAARRRSARMTRSASSCRWACRSRPVRTRERRREMVSIMHSRLQGRPLRSEVRVDAFEIGASVRPGAARVVINDAHPRGRELGRLLLSTRSLALSRMPRSASTLFAPH